MGNCWGSKKKQSPASTANLNSGVSGSQATTSGTSSTSGNVSRASQFSASSGDGGSPHPGLILPTANLREFTFQELKVATRNFKADTLLGEGGFGKVYKGWIDDKQHHSSGRSSSSHSGVTVAIKKLDSESLQGFEEWQSEVNFLGSLTHPNLVKLLGYCYDDNELLLVYEFMQRGSLENHLFGRGSTVQPLPWDLRLKIAIGAARGLSFLHTSGDRIIYRDIKASNILLDGAYTPKISDFGLAKLGPSASRSHVTTRVMGTHGYAAPEYVATGHLYVKSDVYGFGVVLLELLTGLRAIDPTRPTGKQTLVEWIKPYLSDKRKLKAVMDTGLQGKYPSKAAAAAAELALKCIEQEPKARPGMKEVLETLESIQSMDVVKPKVQRRNPGPNGSTIRPVGHGPRTQHNSARARR